ncbi:hypothetical protein RugamoR64_18620 [Duganella rhizosphaerae]|uniref:hypothetical protein n=1 Tax=Duganella rhizosphaerae TaxID=2885763 RepID=UPI0030EB0A09
MTYFPFIRRADRILPICAFALPLALPLSAQASISLSAKSNDTTTVTYQVTYSGSPTTRQLFLDIDHNAATGYPTGGIGGDFQVNDSVLSRYTGQPSNPWQWSQVGKVSYSNQDNPDGTHTATWVIARSVLGAPASLNIVARVVYNPTTVAPTAAVTHTMNNNNPVLARDPLKQPFASSSIWNRSIGTGAVYVPANLPGNPGTTTNTSVPSVDNEMIVLRPTAPLQAVRYSAAAWTGRDRCTADSTWPSWIPGGLVTTVPMPDNFVVPNSGGNNTATFLMQDNRTVVQAQPMARCVAGDYATASVAVDPVDLYGPGIIGAHGGSGLSSFGGSIRVGELTPHSTQGPRHALKLNLDAKQFLFRCGQTTASDCYRWPATKADSYAMEKYGTLGPGTNLAMRMGALLAIPTSVNIDTLGLSDLGHQIAWTLQNYGVYIVDDTGGPGYDLSVQSGPDGSVLEQVQNDFKTPFRVTAANNTPWSNDFQKLMTLLQVVDNNTSVAGPAGGGVPLQAPLPDLPAL